MPHERRVVVGDRDKSRSWLGVASRPQPTFRLCGKRVRFYRAARFAREDEQGRRGCLECVPNGIGVHCVEDAEAREAGGYTSDLTKHLGREARSAHTEQHDVGVALGLNRLGKCVQSRKPFGRGINDVEPSEPVGDSVLDCGVGAPDVEPMAPERLAETDLLESAVCLGQRRSDRTGIDAQCHAGDGNARGCRNVREPINYLEVSRILYLFLYGALTLSGACARSDARDADALDFQRPASAAPSAGTETRAAARPRIVFLGDSLTAGFGLNENDYVTTLIQSRLDAAGYRYEVVNRGVSGDTSAGGLSRLEWSLEGDVDVLVVELGGNDGLRGLPAAQLKRNLDEIITRTKSRGITVVLTGMEAPPSYGPAYTSEFRQVYRDLARDHDVVFVPFWLEGVAGISSLNQRDQIHPNGAGNRIIEQTLWRALEPVLEKPGR